MTFLVRDLIAALTAVPEDAVVQIWDDLYSEFVQVHGAPVYDPRDHTLNIE